MIGKYYFQQLADLYRCDIIKTARFYLDTAPFEDDIRTYGLDAVLDEVVDDTINRYNTARTVHEWFALAENINEYV